MLYGGVSLAIYMHGTTKELHRLVKASALEDHGADAEGTPSERVYRELLRETAERNEGVRTRVVVDVIAGTSAGGMNGVYLAKSLAHNRSQDALRDLWLSRGDIKQLAARPGLATAPPQGAVAARHRPQEAPAQGRRHVQVDLRRPPRHGRAAARSPPTSRRSCRRATCWSSS